MTAAFGIGFTTAAPLAVYWTENVFGVRQGEMLRMNTFAGITVMSVGGVI